jgi:CHAT domain-containing protein/Tfp pilus assembly protein PilF
MKMLRLAGFCGLLCLLFCDVSAQGARDSAEPVALVYWLRGEATLTVPSEERRPLRLFDRLPAGATVEVGPGSRLALAFANGRRYELGERSRAMLGPADLSLRSGPVRTLPSVPPLPRLLPIAEEERPGLSAGAVRIRAERFAGLYPRRGAAALAGVTVLRFEPVEGAGKYGLEVQDRQGNVVFAIEVTASPVSLPAEVLQPGTHYHWTVRTLERVGPVAKGEADFVTLPSGLAQKRETLRTAVEAAGDGASLVLLAEVDRSLGMLIESRDGLRAAVEKSPGDAALAEELAVIERQLEEDQTVPPEKVVIEAITPGSAGERAGLQPGDELSAWSSESGGSGVLRTPFDLGHVKIEHAPRGIVTLQGFREGKEKTWHVSPGVWGIEARPALDPDLLAMYEQGRQRLAARELDAGAALWRSMLEALERQAAPEHTSWLESQLAKAFAVAGRWPEADAAWERAARRLEVQATSGAAQVLDEWGRALGRRDALDRSEACHRRALLLEPEESLGAARELGALGTIARQRNDLKDAEDLLRQAYSIREKLAPGSLDLAASITDLGYLAGLRNDVAAAAEHFSKALELQQRLAPESREFATTLINLAIIAQLQADFATSEKLFRRAIELLERLSPDDPELARALMRLGLAEKDRGDLAIAEERFQRALAIRQKLASESVIIAGSLQSLGVIAKERGDLAAAEEYYRRALEMREKLAPGSGAVAESLGNLGNLERSRGNLAMADEYLRRALAIQEEEKISPERRNATLARLGLAAVAVDRGDLALAEELYGRALSLLEEKFPGTKEVSVSLEGLGEIAFRRGELAKAEELFRRALAILEKIAPGSMQLGTLLNELGQVHRRAGRLAMATEHFCRATEALDQQRGKLGGTMETRAAFGGTAAELYRDCLAALVDNGRPEEAFRILERGRARSFLDLLAQRELSWMTDLPPELARDRKQTDADYDRTQAALSRLSPVRDQAEVDRLLVRLRELRTHQEEIAAKIRRASPRAAALQDPQPLDLAGAQAALDPGSVFLTWSIGREQSFLFVVQPAGADPGLAVFPISSGDQALRQRVESFRNLLQRADSDRAVLREQARELYDTLFRPAEPMIAAARRILVSPDGPLHTLPVAALVRDGGWLAEQKPIHSVLSATVYAELKKSPRPGLKATPAVFAAFGDPLYPPLPAGHPSTADPEVRAAVGRGLSLSSLPSTRDEVRGIASLYPEARTFLGAEATEERARSIGKDTRYLHFACHGLLDERLPLNSALALTIPEHPGEGQENGLLQAWEIFESLRIDADLVTLSSCDSALGQEIGGEGLISLTRAFQYAGARSVLASLWSVSDLSTADLMKRFYGHLRAGEPKDQALRGAQVELIHSSKFSHPYHWAAFQLVGGWK